MTTAKAVMWLPEDRERLTALMDSLAAVQLDLKPLCNREQQPLLKKLPELTIAEACEILQASIVELREVMLHLDGISELGRSVDE